MGFRCSSTGKLAGYDETTAELQSDDISDTELTASVRVVRPCSGCGQDQAEAEFEFNIALDHECPDQRGDVRHADGETERPFEESDFEETLDERTFDANGTVEAEVYDEYERTDRHGKPIKSFRYQRRKIGATITAEVTCSRCEEAFSVTETDWQYASGYEDQGSH